MFVASNAIQVNMVHSPLSVTVMLWVQGCNPIFVHKDQSFPITDERMTFYDYSRTRC